MKAKPQNDPRVPTRPERILNRLLSSKTIHNCEGLAYLIRWYLLRTSFVAVFVHKFVRSDEDRALHDHPWNFLVIPIWRGYREHSERPKTKSERAGIIRLPWWSGWVEELNKPVAVVRRVWPILGIRYRKAEYRHRVELIAGKASWSIFIRFRERRGWGFWPKQGFIPNKTWWENNCE